MGLIEEKKSIFSEFFGNFFSQKSGRFPANSLRSPITFYHHHILRKLKSAASFVILGPKLRILSTKRVTFQNGTVPASRKRIFFQGGSIEEVVTLGVLGDMPYAFWPKKLRCLA